MSKKNKKNIMIGMALAVCIACGVIIGLVLKSEKQQEVNDIPEQAIQDEHYITYNGDKYEYNYDLRNILFIGVDNADEMQEYEEGYAGQADCLILLSADKEKKQTTLLEISRDSMTDVEVYGQDGTSLGPKRMQIAAQYAYGDGQRRSCQLTSNAVSRLLYEIPIHAYVALNVDGIAEVTELMGGVTITIPEDYTSIDPMFQKGVTIVLKGKQAERYVRYRDVNETGSNMQRMERQTQFLKALAMQLSGKDIGWYQKLLEEAGEYITTDISLDEMERLKEYPMNEEVQIVPGEVHQGEVHDEFIVDNEKLKEIIIKLFYKVKE